MVSREKITRFARSIVFSLFFFLVATPLFASETDLKIPDLSPAQNGLLYWGFLICILGMFFGVYMYSKVKKIPAHKCMLDVSEIIFQTCKTYLIQQGKFLLGLEIIIGICIFYYFRVLSEMSLGDVAIVLGASIVGILGSYGVAWFGIRMNTLANSRMAFSSLEGKPSKLPDLPLTAR